MVSTLVLEAVISIPPMDRFAVDMFIPAVLAVPALLNCAMFDVVQAAEPVFGVQFVLVNQSVGAPVFVHGMMMLEEGTNSPVASRMAEKLFVPLLKAI